MAETSGKQDASWAAILRQAISSSGMTVYAIAKAASTPERQMPQSMLKRFMDGASINLETAERIGRVLDLSLVQNKSAKRSPQAS